MICHHLHDISWEHTCSVLFARGTFDFAVDRDLILKCLSSHDGAVGRGVGLGHRRLRVQTPPKPLQCCRWGIVIQVPGRQSVLVTHNLCANYCMAAIPLD